MGKFSDMNAASKYSAMLEDAQGEQAAEAGARYRDVFTPKLSPAGQAFRGALQTSTAIGEGAMFPVLFAQHLLTKGINALAGQKVVDSPYETLAAEKQKLGLEPRNATERFTVAAAHGMGGAGGVTKMADAASAVAKSDVGREILKTLAERPVSQGIAGTAAGLSSQTAAERGAGPATQFVAGLAGGMLPSGIMAGSGALARLGDATGATNAVASRLPGLPDSWRQAAERRMIDAGKERAANILTKRLDDSGMTPDAASETLAPGQTIAELSKPLADIAGAVVRRSPRAAARAESLVDSRKAARSSELLGRIETDVAGTPATTTQADDYLVAMEKAAGPLYEKAYQSAPPIIIPKDLLKRPLVVRAYQTAQKMAKERGYSLPDINMSSVQPIPPLNLRQADLLKRAMDDELFLAKAPEQGIGKAQHSDMRDTRSMVVRAIDEQAGPDYAAARAKFAGPAEARNALELGSTADKMTAEEIARYLADPAISEFEKQAFRIGAGNRFKGRVASASDSRETAGLFASPNAQQSLEQLSNARGPSVIPEILRRQRKQAAFEQGLLGGSQTQPRAAADALLDESVASPPTSMADLARRLTQGIMDRARTGTDATMDELARLLLSPNMQESQAALRALQMRLALPANGQPIMRAGASGTGAGLLTDPSVRRPRSLLEN